MDGKGALFATLCGDHKEILQKFSVELPPKHGRGGQSAARMGRIRMEKRHNFVRKVAETAVKLFITDDKVNISGLILAGSAQFKVELSQTDLLDPRLQREIIKIVDINYGGESGFNQAVNLSADVLGNIKFIREKNLLDHYFEEIAQNTGRYCFGVDDTLTALEAGAVETLMVWENLEVTRYIMSNHKDNSNTTLLLKPDQQKDRTFFIDEETGVELEIVEEMSFVEWLVNNYKSFGSHLEIVTDKTPEGAQFVRGFGGIGGLLRYRMEFQSHDDLTDLDLDDLDLDDY